MPKNNDKIDRLHIALTLTVIILEGINLIERFETIIGDYFHAWVLQILAIVPIIPLFYLFRRLNFSRNENGALRYSRIWRDASSVFLGIGIVIPILVLSPRKVVSSHEPVLVTDIDDYTLNRVFSSVSSRQLLALALKQSPRLSIFSDDRLGEALDLMEKPRSSRITPDLGREICTREGLGPLIIWSAFEVEGSYTLQAKIIDPTNWNVLSDVTAGPFGQGQTAVLESIDSIGKQLQKKFGDSILQIRKSTKPLTRATTRSLPALMLYSEALQDLREYKYDAATPKLRKALEFDPEFALALVEMASIHEFLGDTQSAIGCLSKAYERRDTLTEPERVRVIEYYYWLVKNDHEGSLRVLNDFLIRYPRNQDTLPAIASSDYQLMRFEDAVDINRRLLGPPKWRQSSAETAAAMWEAELSAGQLAQALETAREITTDMPDLDDNPYMVALTRLALGDISAVQQQISDLESQQNSEAALWLSGELDVYRGKLADTVAKWNQYIPLIKPKEPAGTSWMINQSRAHLWVARIAILCGDTREARKHLDQVTGVTDLREDLWAEVGKYYARLGDVAKARAVLERLRTRLEGRSTNQNLSLLKLLESEIELATGKSEGSFLIMSQAPVYPWAHSYWQAQESRAYVALASGHPDYVIKVCREMLQNKGLAFASDRIDIWVLAHYYLGVAYQTDTKRDLALTALKEFLTFWHEGNLPQISDAQKRVSRLG